MASVPSDLGVPCHFNLLLLLPRRKILYSVLLPASQGDKKVQEVKTKKPPLCLIQNDNSIRPVLFNAVTSACSPPLHRLQTGAGGPVPTPGTGLSISRSCSERLP